MTFISYVIWYKKFISLKIIIELGFHYSFSSVVYKSEQEVGAGTKIVVLRQVFSFNLIMV